MSITLGKTDLIDYNLHLSDGNAVVRNPMINALINAKLPGISADNRKILATPMFTGTTASNERIQWQTEQFASEQPRPLSQLTGDEHQRYQDILQRAFEEYSRDCSRASAGVRDVLAQAITYHSEDKVFCADGKVVITEWGMHPKDRPNYHQMTLGIDIPDNGFGGRSNQNYDGPDNDSNAETGNSSHSSEDQSQSQSQTQSDTPSLTDSNNAHQPEQVDDNGRLPQSNTDENTASDQAPRRDGIDNVDFGFDNITPPRDEENNLNDLNRNFGTNSNPNSDGSYLTHDININVPNNNGPINPNGGGIPPYDGTYNNGGTFNNGNGGNFGPMGNGGNYGPMNNGGYGGGAGYGGAGYSGGGTIPPSGGIGGGTGVVYPSGRRRRPWWKWLLWLLLLLLILFILFALLRSCHSDPMKGVLPVAPELTEDDISLSEDSVNMEVNNRLILLVAHGGTIPEFVKEFRKKYPDTKKYILSNPDTLIPRLVLTLPKEEKNTFKNNIQTDFPAWDIVVVPDAIYAGSSTTVNDPALTDKKKRWYFDMTEVFDAWDVTMGDEELIVAVIDDGFDLSHPELQGKVVMPYNAVTHDANVFPSKSGHGTHVAATAVGNANNGEGIAGIAPNCKLMPIQVGDRNGVMTNSAILDGVLYAIYNGADVVNMSLGMYFNPMLQYAPVPVQKNMRANNFLEEEKLWNKIFELAEERNVSFVIAGGNQNLLIGLDPMQRSPHTIKVSAVKPDKYKADFSNYGDYSVLSAPGVEIFNAVPGNSYTFMDGTSMASPIVAGGVALLKSNDPSLTTSDVAKILQETGIPSPSDVGPIVNFGRALRGEKTPGVGDGPDGPGEGYDGDCDAYQRRYNELLEELERLKREHPRCVAPPDTLTIPTDPTVEDFRGTWKSTTPLYNDADQEVVIYFTFNGSSTGVLKYVEPSGDTYTSPLSIRVDGNKIYMSQTEKATSTTGSGYYEKYDFVLTPGKDRKATGRGQHHARASNVINFQLIRLNR